MEQQQVTVVRKPKMLSGILKYDISQPSVELESEIPKVHYLLAEENTTLDDAGNMLHAKKAGLFSSLLSKPKSNFNSVRP